MQVVVKTFDLRLYQAFTSFANEARVHATHKDREEFMSCVGIVVDFVAQRAVIVTPFMDGGMESM